MLTNEGRLFYVSGGISVVFANKFQIMIAFEVEKSIQHVYKVYTMLQNLITGYTPID